MTVTDEMVLAGALAVRKRRMELNGMAHAFDPAIPPLAEQLDLTRCALTAALSDQVVVPKEPTEEMLIAGVVANQSRMVGDVYRAMIAAAPASTAGEVGK